MSQKKGKKGVRHSFVYEITNDGTAAIASGEVTLVGTITTDITDGIDGLTTSNFAF